jgi:hypothetical protein
MHYGDIWVYLRGPTLLAPCSPCTSSRTPNSAEPPDDPPTFGGSSFFRSIKKIPLVLHSRDPIMRMVPVENSVLSNLSVKVFYDVRKDLSNRCIKLFQRQGTKSGGKYSMSTDSS